MRGAAMKEHNKSLGNSMPKPIKAAYYTVVLFGNAVINKIPNRHIRKMVFTNAGSKNWKEYVPLQTCGGASAERIAPGRKCCGGLVCGA